MTQVRGCFFFKSARTTSFHGAVLRSTPPVQSNEEYRLTLSTEVEVSLGGTTQAMKFGAWSFNVSFLFGGAGQQQSAMERWFVGTPDVLTKGV